MCVLLPVLSPPPLFLSLVCKVFRYVRAKKLRAMGVQKYDAGDAELQGEETVNPIQVRARTDANRLRTQLKSA